jgi:hypothetical protein
MVKLACDYNVRKTTKTYFKMQLLLFYFFPFQPLFVSTPNDSSQTGDIASSGDNSSNREQVKLNNASVNADQKQLHFEISFCCFSYIVITCLKKILVIFWVG